ncbi:class Ib ribonucleoside-diphosphate reductase assembly flavoprotein NrdI [Enterococcus nangangensis]
MSEINILYISLTGNTTDFIRQLQASAAFDDIQINALNIKEVVVKKIPFKKWTTPFFTFLPCFLEGGNGIDNGYQEILTTPLKDYLSYEDNYQHCYGIIGSGNRNFNKQFALTAHQYAEHFGFPYLDEFELRGTTADVQRIGQLLLNLSKKELTQ